MRVDVQELRARMVYHKHFQKDVANAIGVSRQSFIRKLQTGYFTISEIHKMMDFIPLTREEACKIFFAN